MCSELCASRKCLLAQSMGLVLEKCAWNFKQADLCAIVKHSQLSQAVKHGKISTSVHKKDRPLKI